MNILREVMQRLASAMALVLIASGAAAQVPADASWSTVASTHFRVTYEGDLEPLARHAAAVAERAHAALSVLLARPPGGTIDIVLADNLDLSNGFATPFPSNRIVVYVRPPTDVLELQYTRDWIELVVTHELAHIFHLDVTGRFGRLLRTIFGRLPAPWPVFPAVGVPTWNIEGMAVGVESELTDYGRTNGSWNEMIVRTAALARQLDEYDRLGSSSARWPGGAREYIYGALFMDYVARRHGPEAARRIVRYTAGATIPPAAAFGRVGSNAFDMTFREMYREWEAEAIARSDSIAAVLRAQGLTQSEPLTTHRAVAQYPRFSPDSRRIAYAAHDWRTPPQLRVIDAGTGAVIESIRMNLPVPAAWLTSDRLITSEIDFVDQFRIYSDLHIVGDGSRQLTRRARLQEPDASRAGRVVAIESANGTNRVVLVDTAGGDMRALTSFDPDVHYAMPRFSPDGSRIAVERWQREGRRDIVVMDTAGSVLVLTDGFGVSSAPAWSPDGRWILFGSDCTGVPNIFAVDVRAATSRGVPAGALRQVTSVLTGAFHPDVSPDGRWIAFAKYGHEGFRIERMPFDTSLWRVPAAAGSAQSIAPRPQYDDDAASRAFEDSVRSAHASADTTTGPVRPYSALRSMRPYFWSPLITYDDVREEMYLGVYTNGTDLVGRHAWEVAAAVETGSGRTEGWLGYAFRGLPTIPGLGLHPTISFAVERDWDEFFRSSDDDGPYADEREDVAAIGVTFNRPRWRVATALSVSGEILRRSRYLYNAPGLMLVDPEDDLFGVRAGAAVARYVTPPLSISPEAGYVLQLAARQRWDRHARTFIDGPDTTRLDGGYRELASWNAAYVPLPFPGFARHVLALRASVLLRDGTGASLSSIGGSSGSGLTIPVLGTTAGDYSLFLPVRGFPRGIRSGSRAWTATAEYRFPIALIDEPLRPFFFDRLSGAAFVDAGHAWCDAGIAARFDTICRSTSASDPPLLAAGGELTILMSMLGVSAPVRGGFAVPLRGAEEKKTRFYLSVGYAF